MGEQQSPDEAWITGGDKDFLSGLTDELNAQEKEALNKKDLSSAMLDKDAFKTARSLFLAADTSERRIEVMLWTYDNIDLWDKSEREIADAVRRFCMWAQAYLTQEELDEISKRDREKSNEILNNPDIFE